MAASRLRSRQPFDPEAFVAALDPANEEDYLRAWARMLFDREFSVPNSMIRAAHDFLHWLRHDARREVAPRVQMPLVGVHHVVRKAIKQTTSRVAATCILGDFAVYSLSPNVEVAALAVRIIEMHLELAKGLTGYLRTLALDQDRFPTTTPWTLRGLAFFVLQKIEPEAAADVELRGAKDDCIQSCFEIAGSNDTAYAEEVVFTANRLIWFA